jgi:hypothetical protein
MYRLSGQEIAKLAYELYEARAVSTATMLRIGLSSTVRLPIDVHAELPAQGLLQPARRIFPGGRRWGLPVLARGVSMHAWGLRLRGVPRALAIAHPPVLPSAMQNDVGTPVAIISQLNTQPTCAPVNASMTASRLATHDSGSGRFATPFLCDSFIHDFTPVYPGALRNLVCSRCSRVINGRGATGRCILGKGNPSSSEGRRAPATLKPERL